MTDREATDACLAELGDRLAIERLAADALATASAAELSDAQHRISDLVAQAVIDQQDKTRLEADNADLRAQVKALTPKPPTLFGYAVATEGKESRGDALARQTANLGAPQVIRHFYGNTPLTFPPASGAYGETPLVLSYKRNPTDVAAGKHDAELTRLLDLLPTDRPTWLAAFDHENDKKVSDGVYTAPQSKAAWEHAAKLIRAHPNDAVRTVLIVTGYDITRRLTALLPDDLGLLDVLAVDPYAGGPDRDVTRQMTPMLAIADLIGKPLAVAETQNNQGTDDERATYYTAHLDLARDNGYPFVCFFPGANVPDFTAATFPKATSVWRSVTQ